MRLAGGGGRYELQLDRVKTGPSAASTLASHRLPSPTAGESFAQRRSALLVPQAALQAMAMQPGQMMWITNRERVSTNARAHRPTNELRGN